MENLSLKDRRRRQSIAFASKPDSYERYVSRLPTPEESSSSHRSSDDERHNKVTRRHSPDRPRSPQSGYSARLQVGMYPQESNAGQFPASPPYQPSDAQRPSLPPLMTVLGNSLSSPPRSPTFHCSSVQPSPQEPTYTSATYKPPSLYPQKKQRTEYLLEPVPPISTTDNTSSPLFKSNALDRSAYRVPPNDNAVSPRSRRLSVQPFPTYTSSTSPRLAQRAPQPFFGGPSSSIQGPNENGPYKKAYVSAMCPPEGNLPAIRQGLAHDRSPRDGFERQFERRDSMQASYDPVYSDFDRQHASRAPPSIAPRHRGTGSDDYDASRYVRHAEPPIAERQPDAQFTPYQTNPPSFFMQSQYDYRQGRARKRSNLPKQSTEIMKTWFDQNITNPYPSEEQKAIFSNATGISMTQVSNWFINHRRRCPELRDKRERTRGRECEV